MQYILTKEEYSDLQEISKLGEYYLKMKESVKKFVENEYNDFSCLLEKSPYVYCDNCILGWISQEPGRCLYEKDTRYSK